MIDVLARLSQFDSCAVSDALDKLGLPGSVTGIRPLTVARRISGRVLTVKMAPAEGQPPASRHLATTAIELAEPGDIIVMEQRTGLDAACWGGNLSFGAQLRRVAGVIVEGSARDIDEARELDFPIFARNSTSRTARGRIVEAGTNVPVTVGDVTVNHGDAVVADSSGVVFIAAADIARVLDTADMVIARERAIVTALREGTPISEAMGRSYETMLKK